MTARPDTPGSSGATATDVHQHLWPEQLVDRLRARSRAPYLRGWTLHLDGEPPYDIDPRDHDPLARVQQDLDAGVGSSVLGLSSPLGIESLGGPAARTLLAAWHDGVRGLPEHQRAWASVTTDEPDVVGLAGLLAEQRFAGVQLPATELLVPRGWEQVVDVLRVAATAGKPVLVHPGPQPAQPLSRDLPGWWAPVVGYSAQLQAAWWAWHAAGLRRELPDLRVVFVAAAGLAPLLLERHRMRGGERAALDPHLYVDTSGHGERALEAVVRVLGVDALVLGSDAPYAVAPQQLLGDAATHAVRVRNPRRLLDGPALTQLSHHQPIHRTDTNEGDTPWTPTVLVS